MAYDASEDSDEGFFVIHLYMPRAKCSAEDANRIAWEMQQSMPQWFKDLGGIISVELEHRKEINVVSPVDPGSKSEPAA